MKRKDQWTRSDYETLTYIVGILMMVLLIPAIWFYDWLQYAQHRREIIQILYRVYEYIFT